MNLNNNLNEFDDDYIFLRPEIKKSKKNQNLKNMY